MNGYQALVKNDLPVSYWPLRETSGTAIEDLMGAHQGVIFGDYALDQVALREDGAPSIDFENQDGYVDLQLVADFSPTSGAFSIEAWCKPLRDFVSGTNYEIFGNETINHSGILLRIGSDSPSSPTSGRIVARTNRSGANSLMLTGFTPAITLNAAFYLVWTYDGTNGRLYVNGALFSGPTAMASPDAAIIATRIGDNLVTGEPAPDQAFNGLLQDVAFYHTALTAEQIARRWAFRNYTNQLYVIVNGTHRGEDRPAGTRGVQVDAFAVHDPIDDAPTTCSFRAWDFAVPPGSRVTAFYHGAPKLLFAGNAVDTTESYLLQESNLFTDVRCEDDTWRLNGVLVNEEFTSESISDVVLALMAKYAPGVPVDQVQAGLPAVDTMTFTEELLTDCLTRCARRASEATSAPVTWKRGFADVGLIFGAEVTDEVPTVLDPDHPSLESLSVSRSIRERITRYIVEGGGDQLLADIDVGESIIPVGQAFWYPPGGGRVQAGPQRIAYTGVVEGGQGGLVGPGFQPSTPLALELADGAGVTTGSHDVTEVFVTGSGSGRTPPGPVSTIVVGEVSAPAVAPTPSAPTAGGAVDSGDHDYVMTLVTAVGETPPSPISGPATIAAAPTVAPTFAIGAAYTDGSTGAAFTGRLKYAYVYGDGTESPLSPESAEITVPANTGWDATVPSTQPPGVVSRRVYMRAPLLTYGGYRNLAFTDPSSFSNTTGSPGQGFRDRQYGTNGSPTGVAKQTIPVAVPVSLLANVIGRNLYRRFNGTGTHKLVDNLDNVVTSYDDAIANSGLGADAPSTNTADANQIALVATIGPPGATAREYYMSPAGGGARKRALTISDNTSTAGTITMSDATLAGQLAEPSTDTSGLAQPAGTVLPGATEIPVAGAVAMPSAGWAVIGSGDLFIRYTGNDDTQLTGIPPSGPGSITVPIDYNLPIKAAAQLTGVTTSSPTTDDGVRFALAAGTDINILAIVDDVDAQAALGALLLDEDGNPTSGIVEGFIQDRRLSYGEAAALGESNLRRTARVQPVIDAEVRDPKVVSGRDIAIDMPDFPTPIDNTIRIQVVDVNGFGMTDPTVFPLHTLKASATLLDINQVFRRMSQTGTTQEQ